MLHVLRNMPWNAVVHANASIVRTSYDQTKGLGCCYHVCEYV